MSIKLTSHFSLSELATTNNKALVSKNIKEAKANLTLMEDLALFAEQVRAFINVPMVITSGFRCEELNKAVGGAKNSQHCFDDKTEILTSNGWKRFDTIKESDCCFSFNLDNKKIEIVPIDAIIKREYSGDMFCVATEDINYCATDEHRFLVKTNKYKKVTNRKTTSKYTKSLQRPEWQFKLAKDIYGKRSIHMVAGITNSKKESENLPLLKLCMACICDGCVYIKKGTKTPVITFNLIKQRKIDRVCDLLEQCGLDYTIRLERSKYRISKCQDNVYEIRLNQKNSAPIIEIIGIKKEIPYSFLELCNGDLESLLLEYAFFDGHIVSDKSLSLSSVNEHNIGMLQAIAVLCGYKASCNRKTPHTGFSASTRKDIYILHIYKKSESKVMEDKHSIKQYRGLVWCVANKNKTVIIRREGKAFIAGNCYFRAIDFIPKGMDLDECFSRLKMSNLVYGQLIKEHSGGSAWIHVSMGDKRENLIYKDGKYTKVL